MVVVGKHSTIIARTGKSCEVQAFSSECDTLREIAIVDAAVGYDCPETGKTWVLILKNALYVPTMERNIIPRFIIREAGLQVNDVPRIHCGEELNNESHCIVCEDAGLKIPLRLRGIFSVFSSRALTSEEEENCDDLNFIRLTPDGTSWDPYFESFQENESYFTRYGGGHQEPVPKREEDWSKRMIMRRLKSKP